MNEPDVLALVRWLRERGWTAFAEFTQIDGHFSWSVVAKWKPRHA